MSCELFVMVDVVAASLAGVNAFRSEGDSVPFRTERRLKALLSFSS
jgi:hypothetical protein